MTASKKSQQRAKENKRQQARVKAAKEERVQKVKGLSKFLKTFQPATPKADPTIPDPYGRPQGPTAKNKPTIEEVLWKGLPNLPPPKGIPSLIGKANKTSNARLRDLVAEKYTRLREPLNLYQPMPQLRAFHESNAFVRLLMGSNRSGKTVGAIVEFARAVLNRDPFQKYPKRGMCYVVGKSLFHLADTIYQKLRRPGLFDMIPRDDGSSQWEIFQPWRPEHLERIAEIKPSEPLIPDRYIEVESFENKAQGEIKYVRFTTGWEMRCFTALGTLPQGAPADLVWLDEEIVDSHEGPWLPEMKFRLVDRGGLIIWSATPQSGYANLLEESDRADRQLELWQSDPVNNPKPDVIRFDVKLEENPYQKIANIKRVRRNIDDETAHVRFSGMSLANSLRVYPEWSLTTHGVVLRNANGDPTVTPPHNWTRYAVIDPGSSVCAVLFAAVPPDEDTTFKMPTVIAYDELYIPQCNAAIFGKMMSEKCTGQRFEAFIIDGHGSRPTEAGSGESIEVQYGRALEANRVKSSTTGYGFVYGFSDRAAGVLKVHEYLMERNGGTPRFLIALQPNEDGSKSMDPLCVMLHSEMKKYRKKKDPKTGRMTEPNDKGATHLCQCLRYLCSYEPTWVEHEELSAGFQAWEKNRVLQANRMGGASRPFVNFGPGA